MSAATAVTLAPAATPRRGRRVRAAGPPAWLSWSDPESLKDQHLNLDQASQAWVWQERGRWHAEVSIDGETVSLSGELAERVADYLYKAENPKPRRRRAA